MRLRVSQGPDFGGYTENLNIHLECNGTLQILKEKEIQLEKLKVEHMYKSRESNEWQAIKRYEKRLKIGKKERMHRII